MVTPMTEDAAREVLRRAGAAAADPVRYAATRRQGGWSFAWSRDRGEPPVGSRRWVVADDGQVRVLGLRERADDVIAALLAG